MDKKALKFFEEFCNAPGPSGFEKEVAVMLKEYVKGSSDSICNDNIGNLLFEKKGTKSDVTVMMAGHMDEVGFIVTGINPLGYLSFNQLGGWFDQVLLGQRVVIITKGGTLPGIISCKPPHVMDAEEIKKVVTKKQMFIDIGAANVDEAKAMGVRLGDCVVPDSKFHLQEKKVFKDGKEVGKRTLAWGKAFDNRYGGFVAAEVIRRLKEEKVKHPNRVVGAGTVQEEIGVRGAKVVSNTVKPDVAIVLDVDIAGDEPGIDPLQAPMKMGEGVSITVFDASMIPNQPLKELAIEVCQKKKIPYGLTFVAGGGTDGGAIHTSNLGVPTIVIGVPTRHIHSHVGIIDLKDIEDSITFCVELIKVLDKKTVDGLTAI
jgi:endoglucanase